MKTHSQDHSRARFWIYHNGGPVRITIKAGSPFETCEGGPTDEGYSYFRTTYTLETDADGQPAVIREWEDDGRDCDGRLTRYGTDYALLSELKAGNESEGFDFVLNYPLWHKISSRQRDEYAEMMGY